MNKTVIDWKIYLASVFFFLQDKGGRGPSLQKCIFFSCIPLYIILSGILPRNGTRTVEFGMTDHINKLPPCFT